jgi:TPR repeat protein
VLLWVCASYIQIGKPGWPRDYELAVELAEISAAQPSELGPFYRNLARNYSTGIEGVLEQDGKKAIELYLKASKHSEPALSYGEIAQMHGAGVGVEQDQKKYVEWLVKAVKFSRTKNEKGIFAELVGYAYGAGGIGFEKDLVEDWAWLRFALENGKVGNSNHNRTYTDHLLKEVLTPQQIASAKKRLLELKAGKY